MSHLKCERFQHIFFCCKGMIQIIWNSYWNSNSTTTLYLFLGLLELNHLLFRVVVGGKLQGGQVQALLNPLLLHQFTLHILNPPLSVFWSWNHKYTQNGCLKQVKIEFYCNFFGFLNYLEILIIDLSLNVCTHFAIPSGYNTVTTAIKSGHVLSGLLLCKPA